MVLQKGVIAAGALYPIIKSPKLQTLIITVGGIGTPPPETWSSSSNNHEPAKLWLDCLPQSATPGIGVYGYSHGISALELSWQALLDHGSRLMSALLGLVGEQKLHHCPILLVAHSLGGLIVKEALRKAYEENYRNFLRTLAGVVLLGTPHSNIENEKWYNAALAVQPSSKKNRAMNSDDVSKLANSSMLFEQAAVEVPILSVHETEKTKIKTGTFKTTKTLLMGADFVKTDSRNEEILAIKSDHNDLCNLDVTASYFQTFCLFVDASIQDARLRIVKGSPTHEPPSTLDDWSVIDQKSGPSRTTDSYSNPTSRSEAQTLYATAASGESAFEITPFSTQTTLQRQPSRFPCRLIPVAQNREFFGRQEILEEIHQAFFSQAHGSHQGNAETRTFAICGSGGIGKTQVATEFVYTRQNMFDAIFWIHADTSLKLREEFSRLAVSLGLVEDDSIDARDQVITRDFVKGWLANPVKDSNALNTNETNQAFWLIVFDNVDNTDVLEGFWPLDGPGCVLFTSRDPLAKNSLYLANSGVDLQPFSQEESATFLERLTNKQGDSSGIHERLGGLPLAITQMASVIIRRDLSYSEFIEIYDEEGGHEELFKLRFDKWNQPMDYKKTIWSVWALETLKHSKDLLDVISFLDPDGIWEYILTKYSTKLPLLPSFPRTSGAYHRARTELLQSSLISKDSSGKRLVVHRLVQDAARSKIDTVRFQDVLSSTIHLISAAWPYEAFGWRHEVSRWRVCKELFPHIIILLQYGGQLDIRADSAETGVLLAELVTDAAWYYHETGYSIEATPFFDFAKDLCDSIKIRIPKQENELLVKLKPRLDSTTAEIHHNLGCIGTETNQPRYTLEHFSIFNRMMIQASGDNLRGKDNRLFISWNELGNAYMLNKLWSKGEESFKASIASARLLPKFQPTDISLPTVNLGLAYWLMDRHDDAVEILNEGLKHREQVYGIDDNESFITGRFLHALGNVKASQGLTEESFAFHQRALRQFENTIGRNHHRTGDTHVKVAEHHLQKGSLESADYHLGEALRIFGDKPVFRPEKARALYKKSLLLRVKQQAEDANQVLEQCAVMYNEFNPEAHKEANELVSKDFDEAVAFWSR